MHPKNLCPRSYSPDIFGNAQKDLNGCPDENNAVKARTTSTSQKVFAIPKTPPLIKTTLIQLFHSTLLDKSKPNWLGARKVDGLLTHGTEVN